MMRFRVAMREATRRRRDREWLAEKRAKQARLHQQIASDKRADERRGEERQARWKAYEARKVEVAEEPAPVYASRIPGTWT